ncbi:hypothetical protein [Roseateles sp.]|uniref:hypothetical protein n=1 Tax=Roseateles sp. TaxID=1971397 RepID=UPI0039EC2435
MGAVLLGHAALLLLAWQARRLPASPGNMRHAMELRVVPPALRPRERVARPETAPPAVAPVALTLILPPALPSVAEMVAAGDAVSPGASVGVAAGSPGLAASGGRGLDLKPSAEILRGALANPATTDPRSNSPKPTFEERIAMGLDPSLCVKLERDPEGHVRRRMGRLVDALSLLQASQGVGAKGVKVCE